MRAAPSPRTSTTRSSSKRRPAPARRPSWSTASCGSSRPVAATMAEIVAVTFTEKAAGELKLRLREALEHERASTRATRRPTRSPRRLERALETLEEAHVNTIHGFCAELLRERPVEARVDPLFTVLTEPQADRLYARAFRAWLQEALRGSAGRAAARAAADERAVVRRRRRRRPDRSAARAPAARWPSGAISRALAAAAVRPRSPRSIASIAALHRLAELTRRPSSQRDNLFIDTDAVRRLSRQIRLEQSFGQRDLDGWEARLVDLVARSRLLADAEGQRLQVRQGRDAVRRARRARRAVRRSPAVPRETPTPTSPPACSRSSPARPSAIRRSSSAAGALDFADLARARARPDPKQRRGPARTCSRSSRGSSSTSSRTPIRSRPRSCCCSRPTIRRRGLGAFVPSPASCSSSAIRSRRSTGSAAPTSAPTGASADSSSARGGRVLQLTTSYRSVPAIQRFVNAAFARR